MAQKIQSLTDMLNQLTVIVFRVDDILDTCKRADDGNRRGKLYSGYETMQRTIMGLVTDIIQDDAHEKVNMLRNAEG